MTHGTHVTPEECAEMRRLHERGYWVRLIATELDVSKDTADYHIHGHCAHEHEDRSG